MVQTSQMSGWRSHKISWCRSRPDQQRQSCAAHTDVWRCLCHQRICQTCVERGTEEGCACLCRRDPLHSIQCRTLPCFSRASRSLTRSRCGVVEWARQRAYDARFRRMRSSTGAHRQSSDRGRCVGVQRARGNRVGRGGHQAAASRFESSNSAALRSQAIIDPMNQEWRIWQRSTR